MKKLFAHRKKIIFSLLLLVAFFCQAEPFRVAKTHKIQLPQNYESVSATVGIFDGLAIYLPSDTTFISGIELNIKVPESVATWRDTVAYFLYDGILPRPTDDTIDYSGNKLTVNTVPGKLNHTVYVPLNKKFSVKQSPYANILSRIPNSEEGFVFIRFQLAMKGAPESLEHALFDISAKPVLSDEGFYSLTVHEPKGKSESYAIYIDDSLISGKPNSILLKTGEHHLSITSEGYRNETRTFIIEQAKTTSQTVTLKGTEPTLRIVSPENAKIIFDGQDFTSPKEPFIITTGDHSVKFIIGDYEVTKTLQAVNGRSYTVSLNVDATISEDE